MVTSSLLPAISAVPFSTSMVKMASRRLCAPRPNTRCNLLGDSLEYEQSSGCFRIPWRYSHEVPMHGSYKQGSLSAGRGRYRRHDGVFVGRVLAKNREI